MGPTAKTDMHQGSTYHQTKAYSRCVRHAHHTSHGSCFSFTLPSPDMVSHRSSARRPLLSSSTRCFTLPATLPPWGISYSFIARWRHMPPTDLHSYTNALDVVAWIRDDQSGSSARTNRWKCSRKTVDVPSKGYPPPPHTRSPQARVEHPASELTHQSMAALL